MNLDNCMKRKCDQCKNYNKCFGNKEGKENEIQNKQYRVDNRRSR